MSVYHALVLGTIQGITEFLPISSSGHLIFLPALFGWEDQGLFFDVMVHLGSLCAVIIYFRARLKQIGRALLKQTPAADRRLAWFIIASIIPAAIVGFFFGDAIEQQLRSVHIVAASLIGWGIVLYIADKYAARVESRAIDTCNLTWRAILFISCAQAIALVPGTSRSGITMTAGLFARLTKKAAAEFSFLMSVPVIAAAGALKIASVASGGLAAPSIGPLAAGFIAAFLSGFAAITLLMRVIMRRGYMPFSVYRVVLGILLLAFAV